MLCWELSIYSQTLNMKSRDACSPLCSWGWLTQALESGQAAAAAAAGDALRAKAERAWAQLAAEERRLEALRRLRDDEEAAAALLQAWPASTLLMGETIVQGVGLQCSGLQPARNGAWRRCGACMRTRRAPAALLQACPPLVPVMGVCMDSGF